MIKFTDRSSFRRFLTVLLILISVFILASCDGAGGGGGGKNEKKITEMVDFDKDGVLSDKEMKFYKTYTTYFEIYPEEFNEFYAEKLMEKEAYGMFLPDDSLKVKIDVIFDGIDIDYNFYYNLYHGTLDTYTVPNKWDTYEYRYSDLDGLYLDKAFTIKVFDSELDSVGNIAADSIIRSKLYLKMKPVDVKVNLDLAGGTLEDAETTYTAPYGSTVEAILAVAPQKEGYEFVGWSTYYLINGYPRQIILDPSDSDFDAKYNILSTESYPAISNKYDNSNWEKNEFGFYGKDYVLDLTAAYQKMDPYTVTYVFPNGVTRTQKVDRNKTITQKDTYVIDNSLYKGWTTEEGGRTPFSELLIDRDYTLYPIPCASKTVTCYVAGGNRIQYTVTENYPLVLYAEGTNTYSFEGWYLDPNFTMPVTETTIAYEDVEPEYYGKFVPKTESE